MLRKDFFNIKSKFYLITLLLFLFVFSLTSVSTDSFDPSDIRSIGYEYLNSSGSIVSESEAKIIHTWNGRHDYYFNKSSGVQFTNNFQDYWTRNIFCGGYKDISNEWVYLCNDALPFTWNIKTDNLTYVNYTGFKDATIGSKEVRVAIRYHLKTDDENLTIQPYIKNIGSSDINSDLGFAWRTTDINIKGQEDDYIIVNGTKYSLNQTLDNNYTNLVQTIYYLTDVSGLNLWLSWNENLNYLLQVKSKENKYNAPVTLGINLGTLSVGQEKSTTMFWLDATAQFGRPNNDHATGSWSSTNATFYESVDDIISNDNNDYIVTSTDEDLIILNITNLVDPEIGSNHILQYVAGAFNVAGAGESTEMYLYQGSTLIASMGSETITRGSYETVTYTLTSGEADAITDYTNLNLRLHIHVLSPGEELRVSQMELKIPMAPTEAPPSPALSSPANNTAFDVDTINFTVFVADNGFIKNVSLYIDGVLNQTNSTETEPGITGRYTGFHFDTAGSGNTDPIGITNHNDFFWITDFGDMEVYKYWTNGTYTETSFDTSISGNDALTGITYYNGFFWTTDTEDDEVYKYWTNGTYTGTSFGFPYNPYEITEYNDFFWILSNTFQRVYKYWTNGTYTNESFSTAGSGNTAPRGIIDYADFFWITDFQDDEVYKYWANGTYTGISFDTLASGNEQPQGITEYNGFFYGVTQLRDEVYKFGTGVVEYNFNNIIFSDGSYNWTVEAYDTVHTSGTTDTWYFSVSTVAADSCNYSSGDWNVSCSDNCTINSDVSLPSNTFRLIGSGKFTVLANITYDRLLKDNQCKLINKIGDNNRLITVLG